MVHSGVVRKFKDSAEAGHRILGGRRHHDHGGFGRSDRSNKLKGELQTIYDDIDTGAVEHGCQQQQLGAVPRCALRRRPPDEKERLRGCHLAPRRVEKADDRSVGSLQASELHESSSGRNEGKDLASLKAALRDYFVSAEGAIGAFADSYGSSLSDDQKQSMRDLGNLALSVEVAANKYNTATTRVRELMTTIREIAKELNDNGQAEASYRSNVVLIGGLMALIVGSAIGYFLARYIARNIVHVADVAEQAAAGNLQARAKLDSDDEVGHMAKAFNSMLDRITALEFDRRKNGIRCKNV